DTSVLEVAAGLTPRSCGTWAGNADRRNDRESLVRSNFGAAFPLPGICSGTSFGTGSAGHSGSGAGIRQLLTGTPGGNRGIRGAVPSVGRRRTQVAERL